MVLLIPWEEMQQAKAKAEGSPVRTAYAGDNGGGGGKRVLVRNTGIGRAMRRTLLSCRRQTTAGSTAVRKLTLGFVLSTTTVVRCAETDATRTSLDSRSQYRCTLAPHSPRTLAEAVPYILAVLAIL